MRKQKWLAVLVILIVVLLACAFTGCPQDVGTKPIEVIARDGVATAKGFIVDQQRQHLVECQAAPTKPVCASITKAVAAQNLVIDALEIYCASPEFATGTAPCVPHPAAEAQLREALNKLSAIVGEIKSLSTHARPGPADPIVMNAGVGFLSLLDMALAILSGLLISLGADPKFAGIVSSIQAAMAELNKAKDEAVTKDGLEALRTESKW